MKINNNCARKVLKEVEKINFGETITVAKLQELMNDFSIEDVLNVVTILNRERYLRMADRLSYDDGDVLRDNRIKSLNDKGYKTLDLIRDDSIWNKMKETLPNFDEISFFTIIDIANKVVNVKHNELFNLPKDLFFDSSRW